MRSGGIYDEQKCSIKIVMCRSFSKYDSSCILTDKSKFGEVSSVTFGGFTDAKILTEEIPEEYEDSKNILKVK